MQPYAEMMTTLCGPLAKTPTPLLERVMAAIVGEPAVQREPMQVLQSVRDVLATYFNFPSVDDFVVSAVLMVVATELENRRIEAGGVGEMKDGKINHGDQKNKDGHR